LALFGRRPPERVDGPVIPASENLHNSGLMHRNKFVLFATSLPRLSIGCAIPGLIPTAVSNHADTPADVWSNADSWVAKPSQAV
jgi:hypothetical protein